MSKPLLRKFIFKEHADWERFVAFMKQNLPAMVAEKRYLQAVVSEYKSTRSNEQNAYMWAAILSPTSEQAWVNGRRLSDEGWNLALKVLFLPETCAKGVDKWLYATNGERTLMMSTSDLNVDEMKHYLDQITEYVAADLGVHLPANPRDL